jgi:hypothetical protein
VDYQLGVDTCDVDQNTTEESGDIVLLHEMSSPWAFTSTDRSGCMSISTPHGCVRQAGGTGFVSSSMPIMAQAEALASNVRAGTCTGGEEALNGLLLALKDAEAGGCNQNFIRPDANLLAIILTDEDDQDVGTGTPNNPMPRDIMGYFLPALHSALGTLHKSMRQMRIAEIVGADGSGQPARCSIDANGEPAACGSLCNQSLPQGSLRACNPQTPCSAGEFCDTTVNQCKNADVENWQYCYWCPYYQAPDCCTGLTAMRYITFARAVGAAVAAADPSIPAPVAGQECHPPPGARTACRVDSICQSDLGPTLLRIAADLAH